MAKTEWGTKRSCQSCGTRFYDLRKSPIICPKCGAQFDPQVMLRPSRSRAVPVEVPEPVEEVAVDEVEIEEGVEIEEEAAEEEDEEVLEDTSELGEDKDDMFEVIEKVEGEDER